MQKSAPQIYHSIQNANNILVVSHVNPDGDALGSCLAVSHFLTSINKKHCVFNCTQPKEYFNFLPQFEQIISEYEKINLNDFDLIITLDCGEIKRIGFHEDLKKFNHYTLINIDHHISNNRFGHHNLVFPDNSSTCEIVFKFFNFHNILLSKEIATCLLTGILDDNSNFTNSGTTDDSFKIASTLLKKGAKITQVTDYLIKNQKINNLKFWGKIFSRLQVNPKYNIGITIIKQEDFLEFNILEEETEGVANFLNSLKDLNAILILKEISDGTIRGSFRTTRNDIDVSKLATKLGGGGHTKAAGFSITGKIQETENGWVIV